MAGCNIFELLENDFAGSFICRGFHVLIAFPVYHFPFHGADYHCFPLSCNVKGEFAGKGFSLFGLADKIECTHFPIHLCEFSAHLQCIPFSGGAHSNSRDFVYAAFALGMV